MLAGIFANLGSINIFIAFIATILGGAVKSVAGYSLGYYLQKHHSGKSLVRKAEHRIHYFLPKFKQRPFWSMFISRFLILGIYWFALIYAGYRKIKIRTFAEAELASLLIWSVGVLALGYFFSYTALSISYDIRNFLGLIFIFFIALFVVEKIIAFIIELMSSDNSSAEDDIIE